MDRILSIRVPTTLAKEIAALADRRGTTATRIMQAAIWTGLNPPVVPPMSYGVASPGATLAVVVTGHHGMVWTTGQAAAQSMATLPR